MARPNRLSPLLQLTLLAAAVSSQFVQESILELGTYGVDEVPLCFDSESLELYYGSIEDESYSELGLNLMSDVVLLAGKRCQVVIDGYNTNATMQFYLPESSDFDHASGRYISYQWDKFIFDGNGNCEFDYLNENGGLEGTLWDLTSQDYTNRGDYCGFKLYFEAARCGNDCLEMDRQFFVFSFLDTTVYWDSLSQYWRLVYLDLSLRWQHIYGWWSALFTRFGEYERYTVDEIQEYMPYKCVSWNITINA
uniref:Uncharacterized protein n=1 Tax=Strombidium rassoulzadegani TaxID=1082188 RepID=A0A7S3CQG5_9SPIT|mmetsp:Transcript_2983/g.5049  ORF Transcript_2983/g.5049 Transcript_2983/m.5049 type:complete len:251 (+) Transcript_2983:47-799(+)